MIRSILSVPGHQLGMVERARSRGADQIAWDLEDSVPLVEKARALEIVSEWALPGDAVRVHSGIDFRTINQLLAPGIMLNLPKVDSFVDIVEYANWGRPLLAVIESPRGVRNVDSICEHVDAVAFGRADFQAATGITNHRSLLIHHAMAEIAMAALAAGIPAYDSPCESLRSEFEMRQEVILARDLGFTGKICIHPSQVEVCQLFAPKPDPRLLDLEGEGAREIDGNVYAEPHYKLASRLSRGCD